LIRLNQVRVLQPKMFDEIQIAATRPKIDVMPRVLIAVCGILASSSRLLVADGWS